MPKRGFLGRNPLQNDASKLRPLMFSAGTPVVPVDHGTLTGLGDDDHTQYVHISANRTITAQHSFSPNSTQAPFLLGANAQGQTVTGFKADQLNRSISVSGLGLSGGGTLNVDRTITLSSSSDVSGGIASILASNASGDLILDGLDSTDYLKVGTSGSVLDVAATLVQVNKNTGDIDFLIQGDTDTSLFKVDAGLDKVGIGTAPVTGHAKLEVSSGTEQLRLAYDSDSYAAFTVNSDSSMTISNPASSGGNLTFVPDGDVLFNPTGNDVYPSNNYDLNLGLLNKKWLTLHAAELWVETLVAQNTIATIGGRILVGPTTTLTVDLPAANTYMTVKYNNIQRGDICYMEANSKVEFISVNGINIVATDAVNNTFSVLGNWTNVFTAGVEFTISGSTSNDGKWTVSSSVYSSPNTIITVTGDVLASASNGFILYVGEQDVGPFLYLGITRNLDGSGANDWYAGDAVFNTGSTGDGFIDIYSVSGVKSGYGPTIVGNVRNSPTYNDWAEYWAVGNMNGLYGYGANDVYGVGLGRYGSSSYLLLDNVNGIRFKDSAGNTRGQLTGTTWTLGLTSDPYVKIESTGITLHDTNDNTVINLSSAGNATFGRVATNYGNAYWNASNQRLEFRGSTSGTVVQAVIDTDGAIKCGGTNFPVALDALGIKVAAYTGGYDSRHAYRIMDDTTQVLMLQSYVSNTSSSTWSKLEAKADANGDVDLKMNAIAAAGNNAACGIHAEVTGGLSIGVACLVGSGADGVYMGDSAAPIYADASGLLINQAANDGYILELQSSDVAHGITDIATTNTFGTFRKLDLAEGGVYIIGLSEGDQAAYMRGIATSGSTTKSAAGIAPVMLSGAKKSGTTFAGMGANENVFVVRDGANTRLILDAEGDLHVDGSGSLTTYDDYDDLALIRGFEMSLTAQAVDESFRAWINSQRAKLVKLGILSEENFINTTRLQRLQNGALWQLHQRLSRLEEALL